jgi:magnesium transporter
MQIMVFNAIGLKEVKPIDLKSFVASNKDVLWIDIQNPTQEHLDELHKVFNFHPLALEDTRNQHQRPKVDEYTDHLFIIANHVTMGKEDIEFHELDIFLGRKYIVTLHNNGKTVINEARVRVERKALLRHLSSEFILYAIIDTLVDGFFPLLDKIDTEIEEMSETVLIDPTQEMLGRMFTLRRMLNETWRVVGQQRDMFNILTRREEDLLTHHDVLEYFLRDVQDHLIRIGDITGVLRDTLNNLVELHMTSSSNHLNKVVNRLTVITIIIGIWTVLSGFYGMNFEQTWPPFEVPWGVPFVVTMMGVLSIAALFIFKRWRLY